MPSWRQVAGLVAIAALAAAGCGTGAGPASRPGSASPHGSRSAPGATRSASAGAAGSARASASVTLAFAGDVHFTGRTARLLRQPATAFGPIAGLLGSADLTALNLETAVTTGGTPQPKYYHFRTTGTAFTALHDAGVDLVTMANNHSLDYGRAALADTLAAAGAARFPVIGIGADARAAWAPFRVTIRGFRIAILGVSDVAELASSWVATDSRSGEAHAIDLARTLGAVRKARRSADAVIVFMHWGTEGQACPDPNQLALAPKLAQAGASIIIGSHAHMLQGSGWLGHTFVAYGMANFLWWETSYSTSTGILFLTLHRNRPLTARFVPATVSATGQPVVDNGRQARLALARYRQLRQCAGLSARPGR